MQRQILYFIASFILAFGWFAFGYLVLYLTNSCYFSGDSNQSPHYLCIAFTLPHQIVLYLLQFKLQGHYLIAYFLTVLIIYFLINIIFIIVRLLKGKLSSEKTQASDVKTIITTSSSQPYLKPDVQVKDSSENKGLYRFVAISGIITLVISGVVFLLVVIYLVFLSILINKGKLDYPELKTIQNDPSTTIRMANAVELQHSQSERESNIEGAVPPYISYIFGTSHSEEDVSEFYEEKLANLGWTIEHYAYRKTYPYGWCKPRLHFNIIFFDSFDRKQVTFKPEWNSYPTVFRANLFSSTKNSTCKPYSK